MQFLSSLFPTRNTPQPNKSESPLDAAWVRYHSAFAALEKAYGPDDRTAALAECEAASKHLLTVRRNTAGGVCASRLGGES